LFFHCVLLLVGGEPAFHNIQGIGPGFVPETLDTSQIDK
jgi:cysteine synthase